MKKILKLILIASIANLFCYFPNAKAATLTSVKDTLSRSKANTLSNHTIQFTTPTGVGAGETIVVTFPNDFAPEASIDYTDVDITDDGVDLTLAAAPSGATWGAAFGGTGSRVLTFTSGTGTIAAASVIIIEIGTNATTGATGDKQITNATTAGSYTVSIACGASDSGSLALAISTEDQVVVSGTVNPYISFNVTDASVSLNSISPALETTDTAAMTAATNSSSGYTITVNGTTLTSGGNTIDAIGGSALASNPGTEQFGLKVSASGGNGTASAPYNTANYAFDTGSLPDQVASSSGVSDITTYTITYLANASYTTEPGAYTATHTYICTGNF